MTFVFIIALIFNSSAETRSECFYHAEQTYKANSERLISQYSRTLIDRLQFEDYRQRLIEMRNQSLAGCDTQIVHAPTQRQFSVFSEVVRSRGPASLPNSFEEVTHEEETESDEEY